MAESEILLKSGTNEVEIAEFFLGDQSFGINVAKIREFVTFDESKVTRMPKAPPSVMGMMLLRGRTIPLIDLNLHLGRKHQAAASQQVVIVTEFNNLTNAFVTDGISGIHRISWDQFQPLDAYLAGHSPQTIGSINVSEKEILILDLERIVGELFPDSMVRYDEAEVADRPKIQGREDVKLFLAEDSATIRNQIVRILNSVGYTGLQAHENGLAAFEAISKAKAEADQNGEPIEKYLTVLVSDIEMPKMDGLTLCYKVKNEMGLKQIPVIMFSSLINEQMAAKCRSVGADDYMSKPKTDELIETIDRWAGIAAKE